MKFPQWQREKWTDLPSNPCINNFTTEKGKAIIGDPQIILPEEYDGRWHAFCHGFFSEGGSGYFHLISDDGINWSYLKSFDFGVGPCYIYHENDTFYLYSTECVPDKIWDKYKANSFIALRTSENLINWSSPQFLIKPEYSWEREVTKDLCEIYETRNPCMVKLKNGRYRLYYSAGTVYLNKCGYQEPKYISFAEGDSPSGPFEKFGKPVISPDKNIWYRNLGAGAIKVFAYDDKFLALYNSIYTDEKDCQHSAINLLLSENGISFDEAPFNPVILPSGKDDWKKALVYQLDLVRYKDTYRLYYNSRNGWKDGTEQIGLSYIAADDINIKKMQG